MCFCGKETEGMLFAAQQALRTNSIKAKIGKQLVSPKCRLCGLCGLWIEWLPQSGAETVQKT